MKVEYLITIEKGRKVSIDEVNALLADIQGVNFSDQILYQEKTKINIEITEGTIPSTKNGKYFKVNFTTEGIFENFSSFCEEFERKIKYSKLNFEINTLWNDIAIEYSIRAYPLINEIENLMRKLIAEFLIVNVGFKWPKSSIHQDVKKKIDKDSTKGNDLHKLDFIDLTEEVLFKRYRKININKMQNLLESEKKSESISTEKLLGFIPQSNWERYFKKFFNTKKELIEDSWKKLYLLRNKVAHNRFISKSDLKKIENLYDELKLIILDAISNLQNITLTEEEKIAIIEKINLKGKYSEEQERTLLEEHHSPKYNSFGEEIKDQSDWLDHVKYLKGY